MFYCLLAYNHCVAGVFRGAGKATVPMVVMLACWCVLRVTYISTVVPLVGSIVVVFSAYPLTWTVSAVIFLFYYFKTDWIHHFDRLDAQNRA